MIFLYLIILSNLNSVIQGIEKNPYFVADFIQTYEASPGNKIREEGEIIFNFKKGIKFDYKGKEKKSYILNEDGFYSKEGKEQWNFNPWDKDSEEYKFFILLIKGEMEEEENLKVEDEKDTLKISSENPDFEILMDKKNYFPLKFIIKTKENSTNQFEFKNHKKIYKEIKL